MAPAFSSYLTSPVIRLIPSPPSGHPTTDTQYIVHRALLTAHSPFLKKRTRESYILLEDTTEATVSLFLEWLYQGDYSIPSSAVFEEEDEEEEEEELHPVVAAAAGGAVGVWAKKPAKFGRRYEKERAQTSGLQSRYVVFGKDGKVALKGQSAIAQTPQITPATIHALLSPPDSPSSLDHDKKFFAHLPPASSSSSAAAAETTTAPPITLAPVPRAPKTTPADILATHLALHIFALRYQIAALAHLSLVKLSAVFEAHPPPAKALVALIKDTYYGEDGQADATKGGALREFLGRYTAMRLEEVRNDKEFKELLGRGGEFAVELVGCVMGGQGKGDVWVK